MRIQAGSNGSWIVQGRPVDLRWPDEALLSWIIERPTGAVSAVTETFVARSAAELEAAGEALWSDIVGDLDPPAPAELDLAVAVDDASLGKPWALLRTLTGDWAIREARRFRLVMGVGPDRTAPALRSLVVVSRPAGALDLPYTAVTGPLIAAAAATGGHVQVLHRATLSALKREIETARTARQPYNALIFDGHGAATQDGQRPSAGLLFETQRDRSTIVSPEDLLQALGEPPPLIVLVACRSGRAIASDGTITTFASRLSGLTGSEVVAMTADIAVEVAAAFLPCLVGALWRGVELGEAVQQGRRAIPRDDPMDWSWMAPVHFSYGALTFTAAQSALRQPPPRHLQARDIEIANLDRALAVDPLVLLTGVAGIGKTTLLEAYGWWRTAGRAGSAPPLFLPAPNLGDLRSAAAMFQRDPPPSGSLVLIDDCEAWATEDAGAWRAFRAIVKRTEGHGVRWVLASRRRLLPGEKTFRHHCFWLVLYGLAQNGAGPAAEVVRLARFFPGVERPDDPWWRLLVLAMRGEPELLGWAATRLAGGRTARSVLQLYLRPDSATRRDFEKGGGSHATEGIDPWIAWTFGFDGREVLAELNLEPSDDLDRGLISRERNRWRNRFRALAAGGAALETPGERYFMAGWPLALIRARSPAARLNKRQAERFVEACAAFALQLFRADEAHWQPIRDQANAQIADLGMTLPNGALTVSRLVRTGAATMAPTLLAAATMADGLRRPKTLASILAGLNWLLIELGSPEAGEVLIRAWMPRVRKLHREGAEDGEAGVRSMLEEQTRHRLMTGELASHGHLTDSVEQFERLNASPEPSDLKRAQGLLPTVAAWIAAVGSLTRAGDVLAQANAMEGSDRTPSMKLKLRISEAALAFRQGRMEEAFTILARAEALIDPRVDMHRYLHAALMTELCLLSGQWARADLSAALMLAAAQRVGSPDVVSDALRLKSSLAAARGDHDTAWRLAHTALDVAGRNGICRPLLLLLLASIARDQSSLALATLLAQESLSAARTSDVGSGRIEARLLLAELALRQRRLDEALAQCRAVLRTVGPDNTSHRAGRALAIKARVHLLRDRLALAEREARAALAALHSGLADGFLGDTRLILAESLGRRGRFEEAMVEQRAGLEALYNLACDPDMLAEEWAELEYFALKCEDWETAFFAAERADSLTTDGRPRHAGLLVLSAAAWADSGFTERAGRYADQALEQGVGGSTGTTEILERLSAWARAEQASGSEGGLDGGRG